MKAGVAGRRGLYLHPSWNYFYGSTTQLHTTRHWGGTGRPICQATVTPGARAAILVAAKSRRL